MNLSVRSFVPFSCLLVSFARVLVCSSRLLVARLLVYLSARPPVARLLVCPLPACSSARYLSCLPVHLSARLRGSRRSVLVSSLNPAFRLVPPVFRVRFCFFVVRGVAHIFVFDLAFASEGFRLVCIRAVGHSFLFLFLFWILASGLH